MCDMHFTVCILYLNNKKKIEEEEGEKVVTVQRPEYVLGAEKH